MHPCTHAPACTHALMHTRVNRVTHACMRACVHACMRACRRADAQTGTRMRTRASLPRATHTRAAFALRASGGDESRPDQLLEVLQKELQQLLKASPGLKGVWFVPCPRCVENCADNLEAWRSQKCSILQAHLRVLQAEGKTFESCAKRHPCNVVSMLTGSELMNKISEQLKALDAHARRSLQYTRMLLDQQQRVPSLVIVRPKELTMLQRMRPAEWLRHTCTLQFVCDRCYTAVERDYDLPKARKWVKRWAPILKFSARVITVAATLCALPVNGVVDGAINGVLDGLDGLPESSDAGDDEEGENGSFMGEGGKAAGISESPAADPEGEGEPRSHSHSHGHGHGHGHGHLHAGSRYPEPDWESDPE